MLHYEGVFLVEITFGKFKLTTENDKELMFLGLSVLAGTYAFVGVVGKIAERKDLPEVLKNLSWLKPERKSNVSYLEDYEEGKKLNTYE